MTAVQLNCPHCMGAFQVDSSMGGQSINCPLCQGVMTLPPLAPAGPAMGPDPSMYPPGFSPPSSYAPPSYSSPSYAPTSYAPASQEMLPPGAGETSSYGPPQSYEPAPSFVPPSYGPPAEPDATPSGATQLSCPICTGMFQVTPEMACMQLACPHCSSGITIPALWGNSDLPRHVQPSQAPPSQPAPSRGLPRQEGMLPQNRQEKKPEPAGASFYPPGFAPGESKLAPPSSAPKVEPKFEPQSRGEDAPLPRDFYPPRPAAPSPSPPPSKQPASTMLPPGAESIMPPQPRAKGNEGTSAPSITRRPGPAADSMLPPSLPNPGAESLLPPGSAPNSRADSLLPPGMGSTAPAESLLPPGAAPSPRPDSLLLPGAAPSVPSPGLQVPLPAPQPSLAVESKPTKKRTRTSGESILIPTEDGGFVKVREPVKTIGSGDDEVELKRLTPEEKAKRRRLFNFVIGGFCLLVLFFTLLFLVFGRG